MRSHAELERLVPWYINGTLGESDQDLMNRHLTRCPDCRRVVHDEIAFARAVCAPLPGLEEVDSADGRARLLAHLPHRPRRHPLRTVAAAALTAAAVTATTIIVGNQLAEPAYRTLTERPDSDRPVLQVVFSPTASEQELRAVFQAVGGTLLEAPSAAGTYRIALPEHRDGPALAAQLRQRPGVRWATLEEP